jgi:S1-C subfamily serine protease
MSRRKLAVPVVAALLGGAVTAAVIAVSGGGSGALARQQGLLALGSAEHMTSSEIYDRAAPSVVYIRARSVQPGGAFAAQADGDLALSTGSGFVIDDKGRVVTNAHVVSGVTDVQVTFADGRTVGAHVVGKDEGTDVAVLAVRPDGLDLRPLELGDSDTVRPGDQVVALGNPLGLQATAGTGRISATGSRVEAPGGYLIDDVMETDAVIEPATSGGPLIGDDGRVVGITSRLGPDTGFAVPANTVRDVLAQLEESHRIVRPYIGLRGRTADGGVRVQAVDSGGPCDRAGLHPGDLVEEIDGDEVSSFAALLAEVDRHDPGDTVELRVLRDGSRGDVTVRLQERPATIPAG